MSLLLAHIYEVSSVLDLQAKDELGLEHRIGNGGWDITIHFQ